MKALLRRYDDWRHERYIARLTDKVKRLLAAGDKKAARGAYGLLVRAVTERSAAQIARMERSKGLRQ
jgi:hypothetical protein